MSKKKAARFVGDIANRCAINNGCIRDTSKNTQQNQAWIIANIDVYATAILRIWKLRFTQAANDAERQKS